MEVSKTPLTEQSSFLDDESILAVADVLTLLMKWTDEESRPFVEAIAAE